MWLRRKKPPDKTAEFEEAEAKTEMRMRRLAEYYQGIIQGLLAEIEALRLLLDKRNQQGDEGDGESRC